MECLVFVASTQTKPVVKATAFSSLSSSCLDASILPVYEKMSRNCERSIVEANNLM